MSNRFSRRFSTGIVLLAVAWLTLPATSSRAQDHQDWSYNLGIYEVNVRQYTNDGTFAAFEAHLDRLDRMGVGILWFMPIHPIGTQNRLGSLGSYYSVRDYLDVNPEFGTLDDFRRLVREIHDRGMYVILDWVANHTAWDNPLTTEHPDWYVTDEGGNFIPPPGTNWSDVIELNYAQRGLRDYMIAAMKFWVEEIGVDGFRFDAVSFVPEDFWAEAISELKAAKPDLFLLAEADGRAWHDVGFDMTHGWGLYGFGGGVLKRIADGSSTAAHLNAYAAGEKAIYGDGAYRMYFTSNHDENSWHGTPAELFGEAAEVFAVLAATFNGMPLIYSGQEASLDKRLQFFDKDEIIWREHENADLYTALLELKRNNQALWNGKNGGLLQRVLTTNNDDVFAFAREKDDQKVFVALNLSAREQRVTLSGSAFMDTYRDVLTDEAVVLQEEAILTLAPWDYVVYEAASITTGMADEAPQGAFALGQNHPNPFHSDTRITYSLPAPTDVQLTIFDVLGRKVSVLASGTKQAGTHEVLFPATALPSGVYLCHLQAGDHVASKRLILLR